MKKRIFSLILVIFIAINILGVVSFAEDEKPKNIIILMNRYSVGDFYKIESLKNELNSRGYVGLMNVKASNGTSDIRSYASIGAGTRAFLNSSDVDFQILNEINKEIYKRRTDLEPMAINNLNSNLLINTNLNGDYNALAGAFGKELIENNLSIAVLGNADTDEETHREACLIAMDEYGRVQNGNMNLNIKDMSMPFGIKTDYNKLLSETLKYYDNTDVLIVDIGDTYRLDLERLNLNESAYETISNKINKDISIYLDKVFKAVKTNDRIYIISPYPKMLDYKNGYRLSPVVMFEGDGKGILNSNTTRRSGILANIDIAVDVLNSYGLSSEVMVGKDIKTKLMDNNIQFIAKDYEKIVSTSNIRIPILYTYASILMIIWITSLVAVFFRRNISNRWFNYLSITLKFIMIFPIVFLITPIFNFSSEIWIIISTIICSFLMYFIITYISKDELNRLIILSLLVGFGVLIDAITGQNMIKNSLLGYDPIIGARYYGVGNEYMGVLVGSMILGLTGLLQKNKLNKNIVGIILAITVIILGFPKMGANVGGTITTVFCFLFLMFKLYNVKVDLKKIIYICVAVVLVVGVMAFIDMKLMGNKSHLAGAISQIFAEGPMVIVSIIKRKIAMNMKLIGVSIWSKVLILGLVIVGALFSRPFGILKKLCDLYPILAKGWSAIIVGSIVGFLVNDSGVVAAATSIAYVIIPVFVLIIKERDKLKGQV